MKVIRNIILVVIFIVAVSFCLYIAPNYRKTGYEDVTNLVINFKNVTGSMKGKVIRENGKIFISLDDINNYYDRYTYYDEKYNYIIASGNGHIACFDVNSKSTEYDGKKVDAYAFEKDGLYYLPIDFLADVYNVNVDYKENTNVVLIESKNADAKQAKVKRIIQVKSKKTIFSRTLEKLDAGSIVYLKEIPDKNVSNSKSSESKNIIEKVKKYIINKTTEYENDWISVRTESGIIGYVKKDALGDVTVYTEKKNPESKMVSFVWDYFENTTAIPKNDEKTDYKAINVVSPAFMFVEDNGSIRENIGESGAKYISWAKSKKYEIWPIVKCDNLLTDNMRELLNDYKKREALINQIVQICKKYDFDGVNIDMENINQKDKDYFSRFIIELKPRLESNGMKLSVDVTAPDGSPNWSLCYDRKTIGDVADYIVFMAYDQTSKKSASIGSNASYEWVENNIKKFIKNNEVDSQKIILAIPFYSRMWKINSAGESVGGYDINISSQEKYIKKANKNEWLNDAKQNYIEFSEKEFTYKMWVEDAKSIAYKLDLIKEYNLAGAAFWEKGCETEDIWNVVEDKLF